MILTLEITGPEAAKLGAACRKVFNTAGGTIGRLRDNYWVLTHQWVSSRHALIRYANGVFYVEDTSTNGTFINSPDNRLAPGEPYALKAGDAILIDPDKILVAIASGAEEVRDPFGVAHPFALSNDPPRPSVPPAFVPLPPVSREDAADDWLDQLGAKHEERPASLAPTADDLRRGSPLSDHYRPPASPRTPAPSAPPSISASQLIPDDYDWLSDDRSASTSGGAPRARQAEGTSGRAAGATAEPVPVPSVDLARPRIRLRPAERGVGDGDLAAVLAGAGLEGVPISPELARSFGAILRVVVAGVMDILQARQRLKTEFRMEMTYFKPAQNNPLKFSANVDDALHNLLVKRNAAYLAPVEAFEDAFDDLRHHQMAMLAGMRVAFETMLAAFDPDTLQKKFDQEVKQGALLNMPGKLRYWDQYCKTIRDMVQDSERVFRELFGAEFAAAYEEQLARLKAEGRRKG